MARSGGRPTLEKLLGLCASPNWGCPILARSSRKGGDHDNMERLIGTTTQYRGPAGTPHLQSVLYQAGSTPAPK